MGVNLGKSLKRKIERSGADSLDPDRIAEGLLDMLKGSNELALKKDRVERILRSYLRKVRQHNKKEGKAFLKKKRKKEGVKTTDSGLSYKLLKEGSGPQPDPWDSVKVHYRGSKIDGSVFERSMEGDPKEFQVRGRIMEGWKEALKMMNEGSEWKLFIPHELAYGPKGKGEEIGPYETLVFELHLEKVIQVDSAKAAERSGGRGLSPEQKKRMMKQMKKRRKENEDR